MKLKTIIPLVVLLSIFGCKQQERTKENKPNSTTKIVETKKVTKHLDDWKNAINSNDDNALKNSYAVNAVKIISADTIINGSSQIVDYYGSHKNKITSIESLFSIEANKKRGITYEIVNYKTENDITYTQIVIWKTAGEKILREFEFTETYNSTASKVHINDITKRRNLWMELCNANNAENLVKQLYSKNTLYYSHKPIVKGTENLIKEYDYMNNETYSLQLQPKKLEIVNANFAFEIGQCKGSYGGKYILVWKKQADGNWYIYIDSNI